MVKSEDEITRLYNVQKTMMEILKKQGYLVDDSEINMKRHQFVRKYGGQNMKREDLTIKKGLLTDTSDQIFVFFPEEPVVGVKTLKTNYMNRMKDEGVHRAIIVLQQDFSPFAGKAVHDLRERWEIIGLLEHDLLNMKVRASL